MVQMAINPYVSVRSMTTLLQKALAERKDVDRHMTNNVRIRARRRKLELDSKRIRIDPKYIDFHLSSLMLALQITILKVNDYCIWNLLVIIVFVLLLSLCLIYICSC